MSDSLPSEQNSHATWLRQAAKQIADGGFYGWGNTCEQAAEEIERLHQRCNPSKVVLIGKVGHYVSDDVFAEIERLRQQLNAEIKWRTDNSNE